MTTDQKLIVAAIATLLVAVVAVSMMLGEAMAGNRIQEQCKEKGYATTLDGWAFECQPTPTKEIRL